MSTIQKLRDSLHEYKNLLRECGYSERAARKFGETEEAEAWAADAADIQRKIEQLEEHIEFLEGHHARIAEGRYRPR